MRTQIQIEMQQLWAQHIHRLRSSAGGARRRRKRLQCSPFMVFVLAILFQRYQYQFAAAFTIPSALRTPEKLRTRMLRKKDTALTPCRRPRDTCYPLQHPTRIPLLVFNPPWHHHHQTTCLGASLDEKFRSDTVADDDDGESGSIEKVTKKIGITASIEAASDQEGEESSSSRAISGSTTSYSKIDGLHPALSKSWKYMIRSTLFLYLFIIFWVYAVGTLIVGTILFAACRLPPR